MAQRLKLVPKVLQYNQQRFKAILPIHPKLRAIVVPAQILTQKLHQLRKLAHMINLFRMNNGDVQET